MIRWNNDYSKMAHPAVLAALGAVADRAYPGYGEDAWCERAAGIIRGLTEQPEAEVHFLPGATQANLVVIDAALRPGECALCAGTGHIFCHEAGSIERTGHKVVTLPAEEGKLTAAQVAQAAGAFYDGGRPDYVPCPRLVYLSMATELGTVYTLAELEAIAEVCRQYGMLLFVDGARLGYGLGAAECDVTLPALAELCDAFYIGLTKCGALFGEAVVLTNPALQAGFRNIMKLHGAMLAKGWLMGVQACALLEGGEYFAATARADAYSMRIRAAFERKGVPLYAHSTTNQQFVILTGEQLERLSREHLSEYFQPVGERHCVRFCTSWATTEEETDRLIADILAL